MLDLGADRAMATCMPPITRSNYADGDHEPPRMYPTQQDVTVPARGRSTTGFANNSEEMLDARTLELTQSHHGTKKKNGPPKIHSREIGLEGLRLVQGAQDQMYRGRTMCGVCQVWNRVHF